MILLSSAMVGVWGLSIGSQQGAKPPQESAPVEQVVPKNAVTAKQLQVKFDKVTKNNDLSTTFAREKRRLQSKIDKTGNSFGSSSAIEDRLSTLQEQHQKKIGLLRSELNRVSSAWVVARFEELQIPPTDLPFEEASAFALSTSKLEAATRNLSDCFARCTHVEQGIQELTAGKRLPLSESDQKLIADMKTKLAELRKAGASPQVDHQEMRISIVERSAGLRGERSDRLQEQLAIRRQLEYRIAESEFEILLLLNRGDFPEKDLATLRSLGKLARKKSEITTWQRLFAFYSVHEEINRRRQASKKTNGLSEFAKKLSRVIETEKAPTDWRGVIEQAHRFGFHSYAPRPEHTEYLRDLSRALDADRPLLAWLEQENAQLVRHTLFKAVAIDEWLDRAIRSRTISAQERHAEKRILHALAPGQPIVIKSRTELGEIKTELRVLQLLEKVDQVRLVVSDLHRRTTIFYSDRGLSGAVDLLLKCGDEALAAEGNLLKGKPPKPAAKSGNADDPFSE